MKYITFMGIGNYENTNYFFQAKKEKMRNMKFSQEFVLDEFHEHVKEFIVFHTKNIKCTANAKELIDNIQGKYPSICTKMIEFDENDTIDDFILKFDQLLNENDEIILGITNAFRYIPIQVTQMLPYLQASKNVQIRHIFYAQFVKNQDSPVIDYRQYFDNSKVNLYLEQFIQTVRVPQKDEIQCGNKKLEKLMNCMRKIENEIKLSNINGTLSAIEKMVKECIVYQEENKEFDIYLNQILKQYDWINEKNDYIRVNDLGLFMIEKGYYQYGITIIEKNEIAILCALMIGEQLQIKNKTLDEIDTYARDLKNYFLGNIRLDQIKYLNKSNHIKHLNQETIKKLTRLFNNNYMKKFNTYRNNIDHGDRLTNLDDFKKDKNEIMLVAKQTATVLNECAKANTIYQPNRESEKDCGLFVRSSKQYIIKEAGDHYEIHNISR